MSNIFLNSRMKKLLESDTESNQHMHILQESSSILDFEKKLTGGGNYALSATSSNLNFNPNDNVSDTSSTLRNHYSSKQIGGTDEMSNTSSIDPAVLNGGNNLLSATSSINNNKNNNDINKLMSMLKSDTNTNSDTSTVQLENKLKSILNSDNEKIK